MCQANGKRLDHWKALKATDAYIQELQLNYPESRVVYSEEGVNGGTWGHPSLAINLARWISPAFAVWCDGHIFNLISASASAPKSSSSQAPLPALSSTEAISFTRQILLDAGIEPTLAMSWTLGQMAEKDPANASTYLSGKKMISASMPVESPPLSPTQLGEKIAEQLGLGKLVSPRKVNEALEKLGLQESQADPKGRKQWVLTSAGKEFGEVLTDTAVGHGKTIFSVRWRDTVLSLLSRDVDWVQV